MKSELSITGFSAIAEEEIFEIDGGVVTGTTAIILGGIALVAGITSMVVSWGKGFGWW